jgi:hypothetical protein
MILTILLSFVASILGSLASLAIWFHYDLEGFWEHKRHDRIIREGAKREAKARDDLERDWEHPDLHLGQGESIYFPQADRQHVQAVREFGGQR